MILCEVKQFARELNQSLLETIITDAKETAPLLTRLVLEARPSSVSDAKTSIRLYFSDIKVIAILSILCRSTYCNNSNYLPLFIPLYLYSARARIDAITLLNYLGISVLYDVLQKKLKEIISLSMV